MGVQPRQGDILILCTLSRDRSSPWGPNRSPFGVQSSAAPVFKSFLGGSGVKSAISVDHEPAAQPTPEQNQQQRPAVARDTAHARTLSSALQVTLCYILPGNQPRLIQNWSIRFPLSAPHHNFRFRFDRCLGCKDDRRHTAVRVI